MHKFRHIAFTFMMYYGFNVVDDKKLYLFSESDFQILFGTAFQTLRCKYQLD